MKQATIKKTKQYKFGISLAKGTTVWVRQDGDRFLAATEKDATIWMGVFKKDFEILPEPVTQAVMLPVAIVAKYANTNGKAYEAINNWAREMTQIGIILADNYMKPLYEKSQLGYMFCIEELHNWALSFMMRYAHVEEWEEFCNTQTIYKNISCWDDFVIAFGKEQITNYLK